MFLYWFFYYICCMNDKLKKTIENLEGYAQIALYSVSAIFIFAVLVKCFIKNVF